MLVQRFRLFLRMLDMKHDKAARLIYAAVLLHNWLGPYEMYDQNQNFQAHENRTPIAAGNNRRANQIRDLFVEHLNE